MQLRREDFYHQKNSNHRQKNISKCRKHNCKKPGLEATKNDNNVITMSNGYKTAPGNTNNNNNYNNPCAQLNLNNNNVMQNVFNCIGQLLNTVNNFIQGLFNNSNITGQFGKDNIQNQPASNPFGGSLNTSSSQNNTPYGMNFNGHTSIQTTNIYNNNMLNNQTQEKKITGNDAANISNLQGQFDKNYNHAEALKKAGSGVSYDMYRQRYNIEGLISIYKATGDKKYINNALELSEAYQKAGKDMDGDGYLDWKSPTAGQKFNHSHHEWRAAAGISDVIGAIKTDPALAEFNNRADNLANFVDKHVWDKAHNVKGRNGKIQDTDNTHFIGRMGSVAVNMYKATGDPKYREYIETKGQQLKDSLKLGSDGTYNINMTTKGGEFADVSHAGDTINFIVEAAKAGIVFDQTDLQRLAKTVKTKMWNGKGFSDMINGSSSSKYSGVGQHQEGWVKLAEFDPDLQSIYLNFVKSQKGAIATNLSANLARILAYN
jgi:hypothetical protein